MVDDETLLERDFWNFKRLFDTFKPPGKAGKPLKAVLCVSEELGEGRMGSALNGVTANVTLSNRGSFWVPPLSSQKCQGVPFSPNCQDSLLLQRPH